MINQIDVYKRQPIRWSSLRGDTPAPSHTPAAVGDDEVTYGYVP